MIVARVQSNGPLLSISFAHLLNDWYMNYIHTLLPFFIAQGMAVSEGAFLISAFTITSSMLQPLSGYLVDRRNQRWLVYVGTLWMAVMLSLIGILKSYALLLLVVTLAGFGTAAFHPQASAMVTFLAGKRRGSFQALFITSGNIGWALTPLTIVPFVQSYGLGASPVFALPGILAAALLWLTAPTLSASSNSSLPLPLWRTIRPALPELGKVVTVVSFRSLTAASLVAFLPLYLQHQNVPLLYGSRLLSLMLFMSSIGGLIGGYLSDRLGRKPVIVWSHLLAGMLFFVSLNLTGKLSYLLFTLASTVLGASFSVTVVLAQEVIVANAALAAGLMLGFGIGVGGMGVGLMGFLIERVGIERAIGVLPWLALLAGLMGQSLKGRESHQSRTR